MADYDSVPNTIDLPKDDVYHKEGNWYVTCLFCDVVKSDQFMEVALHSFRQHAIKEHLFPGSGLYMNPKEYAEREAERKKYRAVMGSSDIAHQMNREGL